MFSPYYHLAGNILLANFNRLNRPYKLMLALTYRCNLRCRYCRIWERPPGAEMELEEIASFFDRQPYFSWIDLGGGEVTLRPDLLEIIRTIVVKSPDLFLLHFPTNGFFPERVISAARLVKSLSLPRFIVSVSIDGPPEVHNRLRGVERSFRKALETFEGLRRRERVEAYLGMTLGAENYGLIGETFKAVKEVLGWVKKSDFHFNLAQNAHYYQNLGQAIAPPPELAGMLKRLVRGFRRWKGPQQYLEYRYLRSARSFLASGRTPVPCSALRSSCYIDPYWQVFPCVGYDRPLGGLRDSGFDLSRIWNSPSACGVREEIDRGNCPQCWTPCEAYQSILGNLF